MCGIIVPGGWEEFFRFLGESYSGPLWPDVDDRSPLEVLVPLMKAAAEKFDLVPQPMYPRADEQAWDMSTDTKLPGECVPYFLKNGTGPNACVSGTVVRPLSTAKESAGRFTVGSVEGSCMHETQILDKTWSFAQTSHCFYVVEGFARFTVDGQAARVGPMETVYLPKGTKWGVKWDSRYVKAYVYSSAGGVVELLFEAGKATPHTRPLCMIPAESFGAGAAEVEALLNSFSASMS